MYTRMNESSAGYNIPSNYGGTALGERESEDSGRLYEERNTPPPEEKTYESAPAAAPPAPPPKNDSWLSRLFGGGAGDSLLNSDLLLILIAVLVFGDDGDVELPLLLFALMIFAR